MRRRAILAAVGTDGDVYPFLGLGLELRRRGYQVTLASHAHFASQAGAGGLDFVSLVSAEETEQLLVQRDFWHPLKSAWVIARWGGRLMPKQYEVLKQLSAREDTFFIAGPGVVAARVVQERTGVPLVSVILQPWVIASVDAPPKIMGGLAVPGWAPRPVTAIYFRLIDVVGTWLIGAPFRRLRASLGLKPIRRMFRWWLSPELVLGLFPEWYGAPQADWPRQIRLAGFPVNDGRPAAGLPGPLTEFLAEDGPPVAFTFGTGMRHAAGLFQEGLGACRLLNRRAVLLTPLRSQLPEELPEFVCHCEFAAFQDLFPRCAAVVHHGGIGTVAKALAAGTPQLVLPFAFDQQDNASRVEQLGAGTWLKPDRRRAGALAAALKTLTSAGRRESAQAVARRFNGASGLECAAEHIDRHMDALASRASG